MGTRIDGSNHLCLGSHPDDIHLHRLLIHDFALDGDTAKIEGHNYPNMCRLAIGNKTGVPGRLVSLDLLGMSSSLAYLDLQNVTAATWSALSVLPQSLLTGLPVAVDATVGAGPATGCL